jgi:hypothetical protein
LSQVREAVGALLQAGGGNQRTMRHWKGDLKKLVSSAPGHCTNPETP